MNYEVMEEDMMIYQSVEITYLNNEKNDVRQWRGGGKVFCDKA